MRAETAADLFDVALPNWLATHAAAAKKIDTTIRFVISGDNGGVWTLRLRGDAPSCARGANEVPDCTIEIRSEDLSALLSEQSLAMQLYFQGKLRVTGDPMLATKIQKLFSMGA